MSKKLIVYISGPMTGYPDLNFPAFNAAQDILESLSNIVINPARNPKGLEYHHYMDIAMAQVRCCDAVCALEGWENSPGAQAEIAYAKSLKKPIIDPPIDWRDNVA